MVRQIVQRLADLRKMGGIKCTDRASYTGSLPAVRSGFFKGGGGFTNRIDVPRSMSRVTVMMGMI